MSIRKQFRGWFSFRQWLSENFAGDLEYHPQRGFLYLCIGAATACFWIFSRPEDKFTTLPLVFILGSLALLLKGAFLFRKSSEGLGLTIQELADLSDPANRKRLPSVMVQAAQIFQDFGTGALLFWPLLLAGDDINRSWTDPPTFRVFFSGAIIFVLGVVFRRMGLSKG